MTKILLFGATGNVGKAIAQEAKQQGYDLTIVVRHQSKANDLAHITANYIVADVTNPASLANMGSGDKKTNPIYEGDLAKICVDAIKQNNSTIEAGGQKIYTRKELNDIIQKAVNPNKKVRNMPMGLLKFSLPLIKIFNKNMFDKFAFFIEVMQHDTLAPPVGEMTFEAYIRAKNQRK